MPGPVVLSLLAANAWAGPCPAPMTLADIDARLAVAEGAYWRLDQEGFEEEAAYAQEDLACLDQPVTVELAARLHRVAGLRAWLRSDAEQAGRAFASAKYLDRAYVFPDALPIDAAERALYERVAGDAPRTSPVTPPAVGTYHFDAQPGPVRPEDRPAVFQHLDGSARPLATTYLEPGQAIPVAAASSLREQERPLGKWALCGASAGLVAAGSVIYGTGRWGYAQEKYTALAEGNPDAAREYYRDQLYPRFAVGIGLAAAGGAGLVGTGVWVVATSEATGLGVSGRW